MSRFPQPRNSKPARKQYGGYDRASEFSHGGRNTSYEETLMRNLFTSFDVDGDGQISQSEFLKMLASLGYTISTREVNKMVASFDRNGDGEMDFSEFINMVKYLGSKGYRYGKEALENKIRKAFSILDVNQDGYLSREELRYVLCNTGHRLNPAEFEDFLKIFDLDNNGYVSCEEYINIASSSLVHYMEEIIRMKAR